MPHGTTASIYELKRSEIDALLARNHVGRLAYTFHDRVGIEPIGYTYAGGWIYGRTSPGEKLTVLQHHRWVAFEVDEVKSLYEWQSVVVQGAVYLLDPEGSDIERRAYAEAMEQLRAVNKDILAEDDPAPYRTVLFRIPTEEVTGRACEPRRAK